VRFDAKLDGFTRKIIRILCVKITIIGSSFFKLQNSGHFEMQCKYSNVNVQNFR